MSLTQKLQDKIDYECKYADRDGSTRFSVCDHYSWDRDFWMHRNTIIDAIRNRGYSVSISSKWGVTDIDVTKIINL